MVRLLVLATVAALGVAAQTGGDADAGRRIYADQKCATCHQVARVGNSRFPLDGVGARLSRTDLRRWITHTAEMEAALPRHPAIRMSARKYKLSTAELDDLVAYLASLKSPAFSAAVPVRRRR